MALHFFSLQQSLPAAAALRAATERRADLLAALSDPLLAARAADVRELDRRGAPRTLSASAQPSPGGQPSIVVARELDPAELVDLRLEEGLVLGISRSPKARPTSAPRGSWRGLSACRWSAGLGDDVLIG